MGSSRFARRYSGSRCCFPFLEVLRCFSSPGSLHLPYFIQAGVTPHDGCRVSPFGHPRIEARSAAPRGFSQPPTSFIGIRRQGIHRWLFIAWNFSSKRCSCSLSNSQGARQHACVERRGVVSPEGRRHRRSQEAPAVQSHLQNGTEERAWTSSPPLDEARDPKITGLRVEHWMRKAQ